MQTTSVFIILVAVCASSSHTAVKFAVTAAPSTTTSSTTPGLFAQAQAGSKRISADNSVLLLLDHQVRHEMSEGSSYHLSIAI